MADENNEGVFTQDIKDILSKYDCYNREDNSGLYINKELKNELSDEEAAKWKFEKDSDTDNVNKQTELIDIDKYWNFHGVETPKVDVEFLVGYNKTQDNKMAKNWVNINYNNNTGNSNYNNYFVSANIVDKGFKELDLVLYDRTFVSLQRLISASISFVDTNINETEKASTDILSKENISETEKASINYFSESIKNGSNLEFFISPEKISSNLRIRYGYNENRNEKVTKDYLGISSTKADSTGINGTERWKWSETSIKKDEDTGTSIRDDVVLKSQYQQATLFSSWDEFYITGLTSTLTETGIKYTIKAVSVDEFSLNGYKMVQQYSKIVGKPKTVMATLMNMFNKSEKSPIKLVWADDEVKPTDSSINGSSVLMDYKSGTYKEVTEEVAEEEIKKIQAPIDGLSKNIKLLKDILACFEKVQDNNLNDYSNGQSIAYGNNIGVILSEGLVSFANIPEKKSYLDLIAWPFNKDDDLTNLSISNDYKSNIIKMAKFQKSLASSYGDLIDILRNKEKGFDTKSLISTRDILKIWLANIATEAYGIKYDYGGKIGELGKKIAEDRKNIKLLNAKVSQIKEDYKIYNSLPLRWAYTNFDSNSSTNIDYYFIPGKYMYQNELLDDVLSTGTDFSLNCQNPILFRNLKKSTDITQYFNDFEPRKIKEAADRSNVNLNNLTEYVSLKYYSAIDFINPSSINSTLDKLFDKDNIWGNEKRYYIKTNTKFYSDELAVKGLGILPVYKKNYIENIESGTKISSYLKSCEELIEKFEEMRDISTEINNNNAENEIKFYSSNGKKDEIFILDGTIYKINNFDIAKIKAKVDSKATNKKYKVVISDGIEGHNYFTFDSKTKLDLVMGETFEETVEKYIKSTLQLGLDILNRKDTFLGVQLFNAALLDYRMNFLEENKENPSSDPKQIILDEYKEALETIKENLLYSASGLAELLSNKNTSGQEVENGEIEIKGYGLLKKLLEEEINSLSDENENMSEVIINENNDKKTVCWSDNTISGNKNYGIDKNKIDQSNWVGNYLLDAFTIVSNTKISIGEMNNFAGFLKEEISKETEELQKLKNRLTKIDTSNIGKEIELSLGSQESKNKNIKITKTLSSLLNDFCSQCQPKESLSLNIRNGSDMVVRDGNGDSKKVNAYDDTPKYNLSWGIVGHYNGTTPIVGLYYRKPKNTYKVRMYNWGTGNPKAHCVKSLSIANSNEFAMMHNFNTITVKDTGISATINSTGGSLKIDDFMPTKEPCFFTASNDSEREEILLNNILNSVAKGTITLLGDPSLKFYGSVQPYTYPIYINIKLQQETTWNNTNNSYEGSLTSQLSGYYVITQITHNISHSGYTTTLEIMKYPGSNNSLVFKSNTSNITSTNI